MANSGIPKSPRGIPSRPPMSQPSAAPVKKTPPQPTSIVENLEFGDDELPDLSQSSPAPENRATGSRAVSSSEDFDSFTSGLFEEEEDFEEEAEESDDSRDLPSPKKEAIEDNGFDERAPEKENKKWGRKKGHKSKKTEGSDLEDEGREDYIDLDEKKILPFGKRKNGKSSSVPIDSRNDYDKSAKFVKWAIIALIFLVVGWGVFRYIQPDTGTSEDRVVEIVDKKMDYPNFPLQRGAAYAQSFIEAYMTVGDQNSREVLGYYYKGAGFEASSIDTLSVSGDYSQEILMGPFVYDSKALSDYAAWYTVGAQVRPKVASSSPDVPEGEVVPETSKMQFFHVNVYYDPTTQKMAITKDSPTVLSVPETGGVDTIPDGVKLGLGKEDKSKLPLVENAIHGFLRAYAESSSTNYASIEQYVVPRPDSSLLNGLNGDYEFKGEDVTTAVDIEVYPTAIENELKAKVVVEWVDSIGPEGTNISATMTSTYAITLENQGGRWLVNRFQPMYYLPAAPSS